MIGDNGLTWVRRIGMAEGVSYLLLLGIAMPIDRITGIHDPVRYFGGAHGVLFVAYAWVVFYAYGKNRLTLRWVGWCALASLLPFGTFVIDRKLASLPAPNPRPATPSV